MTLRDMEWKDSYCLGVDYIDEAHQNLFMILTHIMETFSMKDEKSYKHVCNETIKYLKNYTLEHFSQEEAYMRSIRYKDLPLHQKLHRSFEDITIPELEKDLIENDFSHESVLRLVGATSGWLKSHILTEDLAIVGKSESKIVAKEFDKLSFLDSLFTKLFKNVFDSESKIIYERYNGEIINNPYLIGLIFIDNEKKEHKTTVVAEKSAAIYMAARILGYEVDSMGKDALNAYLEFNSSCMKRVLEIISPELKFEIKARKKIHPKDFYESFEHGIPEYSPIWRCKGGLIGFCVY